MAETQSLLVLQKQLERAEKDIEVLRQVVDWTVAIVVAAGGRVEVTPAIAAMIPHMKWRREADCSTGAAVFTAWIEGPIAEGDSPSDASEGVNQKE